jgi:hypothetical protein
LDSSFRLIYGQGWLCFVLAFVAFQNRKSKKDCKSILKLFEDSVHRPSRHLDNSERSITKYTQTHINFDKHITRNTYDDKDLLLIEKVICKSSKCD